MIGKAVRLWKSIKKHRMFWAIKLFLKRISGQELWLVPDIKLDTSSVDGWRFSGAFLNSDSVIYSLGIGDSIAFDLELISSHNTKVSAFDPTPDSINWLKNQSLPDQFKYYQWAVCGKDGTLKMVKRINNRGKKSKMIWAMLDKQTDAAEAIEVPCFCIPSIMRKLSHDRIDLLKMDVEGAEYEIIDTLMQIPRKPKQLLVEFHHRFPGIGAQKTKESILKLKYMGYKIFSVSETGREIGFLHTG